MHIMLDTETWGKRPGFDLRSIGACVFDPVSGEVRDTDDGSVGRPFYCATDNPGRPYDDVTALIPGVGMVHDCTYPYNDSNGHWRKYPLKRDPDTVAWWNDQSAEAQSAFDYAVDLKRALIGFSDWLHIVTRHARPVLNPSVIQGLQHEDGTVDMIDATAIGVVHDTPLALNKWGGLRLWTHGPHFDISILAEAYHACGLEPPWNYRAPRDTRTIFDAAGISDDGDGSYRTFMSAYNTGTAHHALHDAIAQAKCVCAAQAMLTNAQRDHKRYQWLRADNAYAPEEEMIRGGDELDEYIDEEIANCTDDREYPT